MVETLAEKPLWKPLLGKKHCIVISKGFYEWQYDDPIKKKGSHPHIIKSATSNLTFMAGLWSVWVDKQTGEMVPSCTMLTNPANEMMAKIHNTKARMPAFLTNDTAKIWLDNNLSFEERRQAIKPVGDDFLQAVEIRKVGDAEEYYSLFPEVCY
jgi:putative SOS response-associated peptidase YedK